MKLETQALEKAIEIGDFYLKNTLSVESDNISLMSGRSGVCIFLNLLYLKTGNRAYLEEIDRIVDFTFEKIEQTEVLSATFCTGLAGWAWTMMYLEENGCETGVTTQIFDDLDLAITKSYDLMLKEQNYDFLHGSVGVALYFLKRKNFEPVERLIDSLYETAIKENDEIKWKRRNFLEVGDYVYDFGMAHGMIGIASFLATALNLGLRKQKCQDMLTGISKLYVNNEQSLANGGNYTPFKIPVDSYKFNTDHGIPSRLAWCYGDLSTLATEFKLAKLFNLGDKELITKKAVELIQNKIVQSGIEDASFCHGTSGVAYCWLKLLRYSHHPVIEKETRKWMDDLLKQGSIPTNSAAGYLFYAGGKGDGMCLIDLLNGLAGVGLVLLTFSDDTLSSQWDECLLLN
jgi:lantibiotic modifying enzyme